MFAIPGSQTFYSVLIAASKLVIINIVSTHLFAWLLSDQTAIMLVLQILLMKPWRCWSQC